AYGALGVLADECRPAYAGLELADSLALDPHKWLGVPVDCGCVLFREPSNPRAAFSLVPPYLRDDDAGELGWFSEYGPEQNRPFRALRVWATIAHLGGDGVAGLVRHTTRLARVLATMIEDSADFDLLAPVVTSVVAFRHRPTGLDAAAVETLNEAIPAAVQRRGRAFLTGTRLRGAAALRACVLHPDMTEADLAVLLEEIRAVS
ncbi:pyridoxal-dependent decarboxylase, partial [Microbispora rosea]|uniref:pyridoxal phosphate-dependent decarboxylase family protein n=1 Tax=Microbispora rosea TaxID=58117 RepID=UPI0034294700